MFSKNSTNAEEREREGKAADNFPTRPSARLPERLYFAEHVCITFISAYVPQSGCLKVLLSPLRGRRADEELLFLQHMQQIFHSYSGNAAPCRRLLVRRLSSDLL